MEGAEGRQREGRATQEKGEGKRRGEAKQSNIVNEEGRGRTVGIVGTTKIYYVCVCVEHQCASANKKKKIDEETSQQRTSTGTSSVPLRGLLLAKNALATYLSLQYGCTSLRVGGTSE